MRRLVTRNRPLLALFLVSFAWIAWFATRIHVYFVMPDEVRYLKQAVEIAASFRPLMPGEEQFATWSQVQPILMAPVWGLFQPPEAYKLTHVLNAAVMASSVFPMYLLAVRVLRSRPWALVAAALSVVVPWTIMAGTLMTEVSAYPLAIWAIYGMQRAVTERTVQADALALALLAAAFFGRTQLIVLAPALPVALLLQGMRFPEVAVGKPTRRLRGVVRGHWLVFGLVALVALVLLVRVRTVLGNAPTDLFPPGWDEFAREMLAYVVIGVGMLPLALSVAWALGTVVRPRDAEQHAFAVIALVSGVLLTVVIGGGSRSFTAGINDRYLAYLAPLLMLGMLACLLDRRPRRLLIGLGAALSAWVAWHAILEEVGPTFVSPTAAWHMVLYGRAPQIGSWFGDPTLTSAKLMAWWAIVACLGIALARTWVRPTIVAVVVTTVIAGYCFAETTYTRGKLQALQPAANYAEGRDWVDRTLPYGAQAQALLSGLGDPQSAMAVWWDLSFWNSQVSQARYLRTGPTDWHDQAFPIPFDLDIENGAISGLGETGYVVQGVADRRFAIRGAAPVGVAQSNLQILQVPPIMTAAWVWAGPDETGFVPPKASGTLRFFGDGVGGRRTATVTLGTPFNPEGPSDYWVKSPGRRPQRGRVRVNQPAQVAVEVDVPASGHVDVVVAAPRRALQFYGAVLGPPVAPDA